MKLGYTTMQGAGAVDTLLVEVVERLEAHGVAMAGAVQVNTPRQDRPRCDMNLRLLPDGPIVRISLDNGPEARGCRLDAGALEHVAASVSERLAKAELLVINKFGKQEAEGRGLAAAIADAIGRDLLVLVGVDEAHVPRFTEFAGGMAEELAPDVAGIAAWCLKARR